MASLQRSRVNGTTYWRIVESRRVNGKPRAIPIMQLGTADALLARLAAAGPAGGIRLRSFQHGATAACMAIAERLQLAQIIDRHIGRSSGSPSVGTTMVLAACNRAIRPRSKRGWAGWAATTSLPQLVPGLKTTRLTSQFFWDQMHQIPMESLEAIERDVTKAVVDDLGIVLDTLFYDTTNFFTYIDSTNAHCKLPQRGHSKQKRADLRLMGLALLVSRDGQIPLCSQLYPGNRVDVTEFPTALTLIRKRLADLSLDLKDVTLVYDRGNLSRKNQDLIDSDSIGYVSALVPFQHRELMAIPVEAYESVPVSGRSLRVLRRNETIWGRKRTMVMYISEGLREGQRRGLDQALAKAVRRLTTWQEKLGKPHSGSRALRSAERRIEGILSAQFLKQVLQITYDPKRTGTQRLSWSIDQAQYDHLCQEYFGKRILITNRDAWSSAEIILAYRGQSRAEASFRQMKDDEHGALRPQYHWTDQKLHVHAFICLIALLMVRIIEHAARKQGRKNSASSLIDELETIRLAMVLVPTTTGKGRPRCEWQLEEAEPDALHFFQSLVPQKPPFVYTSR
jgi:transposase